MALSGHITKKPINPNTIAPKHRMAASICQVAGLTDHADEVFAFQHVNDANQQSIPPLATHNTIK